MERIATALGVTLAQFFHHAEGAQGKVIRHDQRAWMYLDWSQAEIESAGSLDGGSQLQWDARQTQGRRFEQKDALPSPNDEFAFVYQGEVVLTLEETDQVLMSGDPSTHRAVEKGRSEWLGAKRYRRRTETRPCHKPEADLPVTIQACP